MPPLLRPNLKVFGRKFGTVPWPGRGHAFTQKQIIYFAQKLNGHVALEDNSTAWMWRTGCWAIRTCRPCWSGASRGGGICSPLRDGGIPSAEWEKGETSELLYSIQLVHAYEIALVANTQALTLMNCLASTSQFSSNCEGETTKTNYFTPYLGGCLKAGRLGTVYL